MLTGALTEYLIHKILKYIQRFFAFSPFISSWLTIEKIAVKISITYISVVTNTPYSNYVELKQEQIRLMSVILIYSHFVLHFSLPMLAVLS